MKLTKLPRSLEKKLNEYNISTMIQLQIFIFLYLKNKILLSFNEISIMYRGETSFLPVSLQCELNKPQNRRKQVRSYHFINTSSKPQPKSLENTAYHFRSVTTIVVIRRNVFPSIFRH